MNYRLLIQYDGTRYDGWQRQKTTGSTIQGKIEDVLGRMTGERVEIKGASRTDAGVHARGQVANVQLPDEFTAEEIRDYLNRYLPEDIGVLEVKEVSDRFHSRLNAGEKTYLYRISTNTIKNVFERKYIYDLDHPLDVERMRQAARFLVGEHDFRSFCTMKPETDSTVRTIYSLDVERENDMITLRVRGNGFLYNMVRIIAGTLIRVGGGSFEPEYVKEILDAKDRNMAGETARPEGLTLVEIKYPK